MVQIKEVVINNTEWVATNLPDFSFSGIALTVDPLNTFYVSFDGGVTSFELLPNSEALKGLNISKDKIYFKANDPTAVLKILAFN